MAQPIISWFDDQNAQQVVTPFNWGTIDANSSSNMFTFLIWNNRAGQEDVSKMEEVTITTVDTDGGKGDQQGNIVEAVRDDWFRVKVDSLGETTFTQIGSGAVAGNSGTHMLGTDGSTSVDATGNPLTTPVAPAAQEILGVANDGDAINSAGNYAKVTIYTEVPLNATAGRQNFIIRTSYKYV